MNEILERLKSESSLARIDPKTQVSEWALSKISGLGAGEVNKIFSNIPMYDKVRGFINVLKTMRVSIVEEKNGVEISIFRFPITPTDIKISDGIETETIETIAGKINYFKSKALKTIGFSSFFPSVYYNFSGDYTKFDWVCVEEIERLRSMQEPIKLVITGVGLVQRCYVTKFDKNTTPEGDVEFEIEFQEARDPSIYEEKSKYYTYKPEAYMTKDKWSK